MRNVYLDTTNENECNWMVHVNPAEYLNEQNLIAYQVRVVAALMWVILAQLKKMRDLVISQDFCCDYLVMSRLSQDYSSAQPQFLLRSQDFSKVPIILSGACVIHMLHC